MYKSEDIYTSYRKSVYLAKIITLFKKKQNKKESDD